MRCRMERTTWEPSHEHRLPFPYLPLPENAITHLPTTESQQFHLCIMQGDRTLLNAISPTTHWGSKKNIVNKKIFLPLACRASTSV